MAVLVKIMVGPEAVLAMALKGKPTMTEVRPMTILRMNILVSELARL